jgi:hypothetical protein
MVAPTELEDTLPSVRTTGVPLGRYCTVGSQRYPQTQFRISRRMLRVHHPRSASEGQSARIHVLSSGLVAGASTYDCTADCQKRD